MRKVIHTSIGTSSSANGTTTTYTIATCDDGTMWKSNAPHKSMKWQRLPDVPSTEEEEEENKPTSIFSAL